jgi:hypothetical protein
MYSANGLFLATWMFLHPSNFNIAKVPHVHEKRTTEMGLPMITFMSLLKTFPNRDSGDVLYLAVWMFLPHSNFIISMAFYSSTRLTAEIGGLFLKWCVSESANVFL